MSAPLTLAQAADLIDRSIQSVFKKAEEPNLTYPKYFNVRTNADYYEKDSSLSGLGKASFVAENGVIVTDTPVQGYDKTYTQEMVAINVSYSYQMWKAGIKKHDLDNVATELKNAIAQKKELLAAERIDNAFATSYTHTDDSGNRTISTVGGDGLAAASNAHTREDGGANMNNIVYDGTTYNLPFDYAGLKAAYRTASLMVGPRGLPMIPRLDTLVVKTGSANYFKAMEILGAIKNGKIPESNDNDGTGAMPFTIIEVDHMQNANYWAMTDSRMKNSKYGFQFVEMEAPTVDATNTVYLTKEVQTSATTMFDLGHNDTARSWVFSKGDSTTP